MNLTRQKQKYQIPTSNRSSSQKTRIYTNLRLELDVVFYLEGDFLTFKIIDKNITKTMVTKAYCDPHVHEKEITTQKINKMVQAIIRQSICPCSSPVCVVPKKLHLIRT